MSAEINTLISSLRHKSERPYACVDQASSAESVPKDHDRLIGKSQSLTLQPANPELLADMVKTFKNGLKRPAKFHVTDAIQLNKPKGSQEILSIICKTTILSKSVSAVT